MQKISNKEVVTPQQIIAPIEVKKASTKPLVYPNPMDHSQLSQFTSLPSRSLHLDSAEKPKPTKISVYIAAITADLKGKKKDNKGFPEIANTLIKLGKYLYCKEVNKIPSSEIEALNQLVLQLLNNPHFNLSEEKEKTNLWAVHVDAVWLAHEMKKKNIFGTDLLQQKTQTSILEKGNTLIERKTPMHDLLRHNFNAINTLWNTNTQRASELPKPVQEHAQRKMHNKDVETDTDTAKNNSYQLLQMVRQQFRDLKEKQIKSAQEKDKKIIELQTKITELEEANKDLIEKNGAKAVNFRARSASAT